MSATTPLRITVVSPQWPCGAAWLANALLELDVCLPHLWGFDTGAEWCPGAEGEQVYAAAHLPWRQTLAALQPGRRFRFDPRLQGRFCHTFPWQEPAADRLLLVCRDPRDALYSEWRRQRHNQGEARDLDFVDFAASPFCGGPISHADLLWLHLRCWLQQFADASLPLLRVRFEDCKQQPAHSLRRVCRFLGIPRSEAAIAAAVASSAVSRLQQVEHELARHDPAARQFNRRGQAYEWREAWRPAWHAALGPQWNPLLCGLGYAPVQAGGGRPPSFDVEAVLRWRGLDEPAALQRWAARVRGWMQADADAAYGSARAGAA